MHLFRYWCMAVQNAGRERCRTSTLYNFAVTALADTSFPWSEGNTFYDLETYVYNVHPMVINGFYEAWHRYETPNFNGESDDSDYSMPESIDSIESE